MIAETDAPPGWRAVARAVSLVGLVGSLVGIRVLAYRRTAAADPLFFVYASLASVAYLLPGAVLLWRRRWHVVGWLLCLLAVVIGFTFSSEVGVSAMRDGDVWLVWLLDVFEGSLLWLAMVALLVVFPDGLGAQSPRQRRVGRVLLAVAFAATALELFVTEVGVSDAGDVMLPSPLPVAFVPRAVAATMTLPVVWAALLVALAGLVRRTRVSHAAERRQYQWVLWALGFMVLALVVGLLGSASSPVWWLPMLIAYVALPLAIMVAILRHRLYEIDRVLSRTVAYSVVVALLAGVYAAATAVLALVLPSNSDLAVAASTLLVAGAFHPLRRRIRDGVDRRFNRRRFDAERELERFARGLRDQTDLRVVTSHVRRVVADTLQPERVEVWIRGRAG